MGKARESEFEVSLGSETLCLEGKKDVRFYFCAAFFFLSVEFLLLFASVQIAYIKHC